MSKSINPFKINPLPPLRPRPPSKVIYIVIHSNNSHFSRIMLNPALVTVLPGPFLFQESIRDSRAEKIFYKKNFTGIVAFLMEKEYFVKSVRKSDIR